MQIGLYIHIPFCQSKCAYCDFASVAGRRELMAGYGEALQGELRGRPGLAAADAGLTFEADHIYLGGGTPSVLPFAVLEAVLRTAQAAYRPAPGAEITVEANPGTVDGEYLRRLRAAGANRLSVGVQSFDPAELLLLGRIHDRARAIETLAQARAAGFEQLNLDLIYGLPAQSLATWRSSLAQGLALAPAHLSLYALSVEECTPLEARIAAGDLPAPDPDLAADMYLLAEELLAQAGYVHYEISNWALPGCESRHNLNTWRNGPYLGFGAAAHSHLGRRRWWNVRGPEEYLARLERGASPVAGDEELNPATDMAETMILGLRLTEEGVEVAAFRRRYGRTPAEAYGAVIEELVRLGLLEATPARIRLTPRGRLLGNQVFVRFLPDAG